MRPPVALYGFARRAAVAVAVATRAPSLLLRLRLRLRLGQWLWLNLTETGKYFEGTGSRKQAIIQMNFKSNHYKTFTKYAQHAAQNRRNLSTA